MLNIFYKKFLMKKFFLDEISMVANIRLAQIHLRTTEIFSTECTTSNTFAGINILFTGDFLQVNFSLKIFLVRPLLF